MSAGRNGSSRSWRKVRLQVLARDGWVCRMVQGCTARAEHVDHVLPVVLGGTDDPSNLRAACAAHNIGAGAGLAQRGPRLGSRSGRWGA